MSEISIRSILTLFTLTFVSATIALAQSPASPEFPVTKTGNTWQVAQVIGSSKSKLVVVTLDQPDHKQTCHVQSFTLDKLICARALGRSHTYLPEQIRALILPGDGDLKLRLVLGFNIGLGAAIWGTVVLAAACPPCAIGTGIAAFFFFGAAGATLIGDDQPDSLLYLAPSQQLSDKLGYIQR